MRFQTSLAKFPDEELAPQVRELLGQAESWKQIDCAGKKRKLCVFLPLRDSCWSPKILTHSGVLLNLTFMYAESAKSETMGTEDRVLLGLNPMESQGTDELSKWPGWQRQECDAELGLHICLGHQNAPPRSNT